MNPAAPLIQVTSPALIRDYLDQHLRRNTPVHLIVEGFDEPLLAKIAAVHIGHVVIECAGATQAQHKSRAAYSLVGKLRNGSRFLACGEIDLTHQLPSFFRLTFPEWVDVSQSRDSFRSPAPSGYFVHLSAPEPHLNDIVCKLHNISFDGLAFEWQDDGCDPHQMLNALGDYAILMSKSSEVQLGKLRVVHLTQVEGRTVVGCALVAEAPSSFDSVVMDVQRSMRVFS